ncbi:hypothetical protein Vadar_026745 [Vaccinium darrowii]|nr:hypothetical protein Vadar_026745 [Vaccinium darrowii]
MPSSSSKGDSSSNPMPPPMTPMLLAAPNWGAEKEVEEEAAAEPMSKAMKEMALGFEKEREGWNGVVGRRRFWVVPVDGLPPEGKITGRTLKPFDMVEDLAGIRMRIEGS